MGKVRNKLTPLRLNLTPDDIAAWNFIKTAFPGRTPGEIIRPMIHSLATAVQQELHKGLEEKRERNEVRQGETANESTAVAGSDGSSEGVGIRSDD